MFGAVVFVVDDGQYEVVVAGEVDKERQERSDVKRLIGLVYDLVAGREAERSERVVQIAGMGEVKLGGEPDGGKLGRSQPLAVDLHVELLDAERCVDVNDCLDRGDVGQ